jgi:hypothetical protein
VVRSSPAAKPGAPWQEREEHEALKVAATVAALGVVLAGMIAGVPAWQPAKASTGVSKTARTPSF